MQKEIYQGTNGSGETIWHVVTINQSGDWRHMETFKSKAEAECWMKWA